MDLANWHFALELGRRYGWLPAGTEPPDDPDLDEDEDDEEEDLLDDEEDTSEDDGEGEDDADDDAEEDEEADDICQGWPWDYVVNAGRKVTDDARQWAEALEQALPDLPDHDATTHKPDAYPMPVARAPLLCAMPGDGLPNPS